MSDRGCALLEADDEVSLVFYGDPGNALRAPCNSGLRQHCDSMGDRFGFLNGNAGQSPVGVQADVANYRSQRLVYCDPWVYENDDTTAAMQLVPSASFAASVASQLSPSTKISWKNPECLTSITNSR